MVFKKTITAKGILSFLSLSRNRDLLAIHKEHPVKNKTCWAYDDKLDNRNPTIFHLFLLILPQTHKDLCILLVMINVAFGGELEPKGTKCNVNVIM